MNASKSVFFNHLDSLRFIAFFVVFISHLGIHTHSGFINHVVYRFGNLGVNFFFVISGFLISYLLLKESKAFNGINLGSFFMRRLLRIWPIYFLIIIFELIYFYATRHQSLNTDFFYYPFFLGNFDRIFNGESTTLNFVDLDVLWSISIEEQFYLIIPFIFFFIRNPKTIFYLVLLFHLGSFISKYFIIHFAIDAEYSFRVLQFNPISAFDMISMGSLLAYISFNNFKITQWILKYASGSILFLSPLLIFIILFADYKLENIYVSEIILKELTAFVFALIVFIVCFGDKSKQTLFTPILKITNYLGKISYGLYIYHFIIIYFVSMQISNIYLKAIVSFILTILISSLSYHYFEKRILKLKRKFVRIETRVNEKG